MTKNQLIGEVEFAAIDFESAGARKGETDEPIQIGIVVGSLKKGITEQYVSYMKPTKKVMWQASRIHGITAKNLKDAPTYQSLWPKIKQLLSGRVLVAHAAGTERRYLRAFPGHNFGPWVDSLTLAKAVMPELPSHRLGDLTPHLGDDFQKHQIGQERNWHDALYDAAASYFFVQTVVKRLSLYESPLSLLLQPNTQNYYKIRESQKPRNSDNKNP